MNTNQFELKDGWNNKVCPSLSSLIPAFDAYLCMQRHVEFFSINDFSTYSLLNGIPARGRGWEEADPIPSILWNAIFMGRLESRLQPIGFNIVRRDKRLEKIKSYELQSFLGDVSEIFQKEMSDKLEEYLKGYSKSSTLQSICKLLRGEIISDKGYRSYEKLVLIFEALAQIDWIDSFRGVVLERIVDRSKCGGVETEVKGSLGGCWGRLKRKIKRN
jgi:hypothetical protein